MLKTVSMAGGNNAFNTLRLLANGDQIVESLDTSLFREGTQSLLASGTVYVLFSNNKVMHYWSHNVAVDVLGNFQGCDGNGPCIIWGLTESGFYARFDCPTTTAGQVSGVAFPWVLSYFFDQNGLNGTIGTFVRNAILATTGDFNGALTGLNTEVYKTASADSPLTAAQARGTIVSNFGMTDADCTISLPTAAIGYGFLCILPAVRARFFKLKAGATDKIYLSGVAGADNGNVGVASGYATGSACSFFTFKASDGGFDWFALPLFGNWVAS